MAKSAGLTMSGLISMSVGILILAIIFQVTPLVGSEVEGAIEINATSEWNHSVNADIPTGYGLWEKLGPIIELGAMMLVIAGFIGTVKGIRG